MLRVLRKLEDAQLVKETGGDWPGFVPGCDPSGRCVGEIGGLVVLISVLLFFYVLVRSSFAPVAESMPPMRYALSVNPPATVPALLNGFGLWNVILLALVLIAYGYPIGQFFFLHNQDAPAYSLTREIMK